MTEYAVQKSDEWGEGGRLALWALDDEAREAYKHLGFEGKYHPSSQSMTLDPTRHPDIWSRPGGKWLLTKFIGMKYIG